MTSPYREADPKPAVKQRNVGKVTAIVFYKLLDNNNYDRSIHHFVGYVKYYNNKDYSLKVYDQSCSAKGLFLDWRKRCNEEGWIEADSKHTPISNVNYIICDEEDYFVDDVNPYE